MSSITSLDRPRREAHGDYPQLLGVMQGVLVARVALEGGHLFATDAAGLFEAYLAAMPEESRQYHNCHACRRFFERYAGLVVIDPKGATRSAFWAVGNQVPDYYAPAVEAVRAIVEAAPVVGVFLSKEATWGQPRTGEWTHHAVENPVPFSHALLSDEQMMAEKREDRRILGEALGTFRAEHVRQAVRLLEGEALYRAEKVLGPVRWLGELMAALDAAPRPRRDNLLWRAVASAPPGFAKPRGAMAGTLLEDLAAGMDYGAVSRRFAAKMDPTQYQRPQAPPSPGNIARAEAIVAQLGIAPALRRRFATLADIQEWTWRPPQAAAPAAPGVFGHLVPKGQAKPAAMVAGLTAMTWEKFRRTVLPAAESIDLRTATGPDNHAALVTAADPDAPPILQWDRPDRRNPVSIYVWIGGSLPRAFGLAEGAWVPVVGITPQPSGWHGATSDHLGAGSVLILEGARDTQRAGNALFPEFLKAELREVRSTVEAFSREATIEAAPDGVPPAAGLMLSRGSVAGRFVRLRVRAEGVVQEYQIDRWD